MDQELSYLLKRAKEERRAAGKAATPEARRAHEELAAQCEERLGGGNAQT